MPRPKKGKATSSPSAQSHTQPKQVPNEKQGSQKPKESIWVTKNKFMHQPKIEAPRMSMSSCYFLGHNNSGKVVAKYVGNDKRAADKFIWVPKILVTNMQGPNINWGPKPRN